MTLCNCFKLRRGHRGDTDARQTGPNARALFKVPVMFEKPGMPKNILDAADGPDRPEQPGQPDQSGWSRPRLVKLEPGTSKYERAKAAFDLLKAAKDNPND